MILNSFQFLWLFPIIFVTVIGYRLLVKDSWIYKTKIENLLLIAISYGLYMQWESKYALVLFGVTAITYFGALLLEQTKTNTKTKRRGILFFTGALLALMPLLIFKYTNFIAEVLTNVIGGGKSSNIEVNLIAPLGISFFTFQAVGYLFDVYYGRTKAERNWWDYMLFVCFFPQILSGPISKAEELLPQIKNRRLGVRGERLELQLTQGCKWLLWGMFMKVVFADRIGIYVDSIYKNYEHLSGLSCFIGSVLYSLQIYGDFAGYSFMAVGVGELLGFELINNFQRPYLAMSITEFWRRWHISLTRWLTQNVYIPMGGSRCSKLRQYTNIMVTFLVSGLWHGANWTFIFWGALHGLFQIIEKVLGLDPKGRFGILKPTGTLKLLKPFRIVITFLLVSLAWVFFRMPTIGDAFKFIGMMFTEHSNTIAQSTTTTTLFILMGISIVLIKDLMDEYCPQQYTILHNRYTVIRWIGYVGLMYLIMMCGVFDAGSFIYVNF